MDKLRVKWNPDMHQDIDALTDPNSPMFDLDLTNNIIYQYGSVFNFKVSIKPDGTLMPFIAFTSYDGVKIMVGQDCYFFNGGIEKFFYISNPHQATVSDRRFLEGNVNDNVAPQKFFSTREAIEEYALMKENCISINDLNQWMNEDNEFNNIKIEELFEIVKKKITDAFLR